MKMDCNWSFITMYADYIRLFVHGSILDVQRLVELKTNWQCKCSYTCNTLFSVYAVVKWRELMHFLSLFAYC